jgi:hypothetical protein
VRLPAADRDGRYVAGDYLTRPTRPERALKTAIVLAPFVGAFVFVARCLTER